MTRELFEKAKFGDRFVTRGGQEALFLRLTENSEYQFADFYVKDWGLQRVNRENGKCLNGPDIENDIVGMESSLPSDLDEAAEKKARDIFETLEKHDIGEEKNRVLFGLLELEALALTFSHFGAEWMAGQGETREVEVKEDAGGYPYIKKIELYDYDKEEPLFKAGDKLIVQLKPSAPSLH